MIYYFTSKSNTKCRLMNPLIDRLKNRFDINIIDIDENKILVKKHKVDYIPLLIKHNERLEGIKSKKNILEFLSN